MSDDMLKTAREFALDTSAGSWFDLWHVHVAGSGEGFALSARSSEHLEALFTLFRRAVDQARNWRTDCQVWIVFDDEDAGQDAVYVHTPSPNPNSVFPYAFEGVDWRSGWPEWLARYRSPELECGEATTKTGCRIYFVRPN